jgi:hypothetical protein
VLPQSVLTGLQQGIVNLDDPATTLALLNLNAVVGVTGLFTPDGKLRSMGIQCALCHSTVDDSFAQGIGHRLDDWANRDLNVGAIIALAPDLSVLTNLLEVDDATVRTVPNSWGPGKFDAELALDGKAFRPDGKSGAVLIPPAFGLAGLNLGTWTGFGQTTYWNAFVANLEMHGQGTFYDPRLNDATQFPVAAKAGSGNVRNTQDLITSKLAAPHFYQLAIPAPSVPFNPLNYPAQRGKALFNGKASARAATFRRCFPSRDTTCTRPPRWGLTTSRPTDPPPECIEPRHSRDSSPIKRVASFMTGGFPLSGQWSITITIS